MINLPYDIRDSNSIAVLTQKVRQWIIDAEVQHRSMRTEWDAIEERLNSEFEVSGFRTDPLGSLQDKNDPTKGMKDKLPLLVRVPRSRPNHESILGNFVNVDRRLSIRGRTPRDKNIARIIRERIRYIEDVNQVKEDVYFPMMDGTFGRGLHWIELRYSGNPVGGVKKFEIDEVSCRDVLVDPRSRGQRFKTGQYRIKRFVMSRDDARARYSKYDRFNADRVVLNTTAYDVGYAYQNNSVMNTQGVFYHVRFWMMQSDYIFINPQTREPEEISEAQYVDMSKNPQTAQYIIATPEEKRFYDALYEEGNGVFHFEHNECDCWMLIPCENIRSESRLYPYGDAKMYQQLEDLLSVLVTVFLDNAKRANYPIGKVDPQMWEMYQDDINRALEEGGAAPGIENIYSPAQINNTMTLLINSVIGWIQDSSSQHSASMGELPAKQIAKDTVTALIAKDRQSHGRKDVMIDATLTDLAKALVKMIATYDDQEDIIPITDPKSTFQFIPMNKIMTKSEYQKMVIDLSDMPMPESPEQEVMAMQQIPELIRQFEKENDVKVYSQPGYVDAQGTEYLPETIAEMAAQQQKTDQPDMQAFFTQFPMQEATVQVYYVNIITSSVDLNVRYGVENDFANDSEYIANRALALNQRGALGRLDLLEALQVSNPQEVLERADAENKMMQIAKQLATDQTLYNVVMTVMQKMQKPQGAENGAE